MEFLTASPNAPFVVALCVMFGVAALEGVGTLIGGGLSELVDSALPDLDIDLDVGELDPDAELDSGPGLFAQGLAWLHFGRVPALVLLVLFLTAFGLAGLVLQALLHSALGIYAPKLLAVPAALFVAVPVVRVSGGWIAHLIPRDETSAVSSDSFVGRVATIVLGTARAGQPTQARLQDEHGRSHYVMVEPDLADEELASGAEVLLVRREGSRFRAICAPQSLLADSAKG